MAKKRNNNIGGQSKFGKDDVADALFSGTDAFDFAGVNIDKIFRELVKKHKTLSESAKKDMLSLAKSQLNVESENIKELSLLEKKRYFESRQARIEEQKALYESEQNHKAFEQARINAIKERKNAEKEIAEYTAKWQEKLKNASVDTTKKQTKYQRASEFHKERIDNATKKFNEAVEKGDEETANFYLEEIREQTKALNRVEKRGELMQKAVNQIQNLVKSLGNSIQNSLDNLYSEQVRFNARTTSSDDAYGSMLTDISKLIGTSPFIKQTDVLKNLSEIANTGSNYNIEQRAYLATLAKDIASTFDATQPELLRLNRLLHTDLTSVMMGMEQNLTAALNRTFNDSSFMNSLRDAVASGVLDAQAQLSSGSGTDFAWAVQTWMGALTSAGVSDDVITMLTQGLNYLGSGNVSAMSGNEQLQTLFALAASNSGGKSYSEMLVNGIDASDVNVLMKEMITYLQEIADENKVVQSEYFRILGMGGLSNMTALKNLDVGEVLNLAQNSRTDINTSYYNSSSLLNRVNIAKENAITTMAADIGENGAKLVGWMIANALDEFVGGIKLPSILGLGTGVILDTTVSDLMKTALLATTIPSVIGGIMTRVQNNGVADFNSFQEQAGGMTTGFGTSLSYAVGSSSTSDIMKSSVASQSNTAKKNKKTVSDALGEKEEDSAEKQLKSIRDNVITINTNMNTLNNSVNKSFTELFTKFDDDTNPIVVEIKDFAKLTDAITQDKVQKIEGTVRLAGFDSGSEKTLNDVLTNAIALAIKMIIGGAASPGANEMYMENGMFGNEFIGNMSFMDFLNTILESNMHTQQQISNAFDYFTQQNDTSYIR